MAPNNTALAIPVPLVGQPVRVHTVVIMTLFTCQCRPDNPPLLLRGHDTVEICLRCQNVYRLTKATFDAQVNSEVNYEVAVVGKASKI
jgi:hypothetical protein